MHQRRSSLALLLLVYSCSAVWAKNTWWSNSMDGGETRTTSSWTSKSQPIQLQLGTSMSKRKIKAAIGTAAQTPKKFWESKSFEALLRENQKDGLDNVAPVRQVFKSWEYTKEGNKPAKLVEKSWEKTGDFIIPPTVTVIEHNDNNRNHNNGNQNQKPFKLNDWTTQTPKQTPPVRWDDKPEFSSIPKQPAIRNQNFQKPDFEKFEKQKHPKVKIVAKKLITLKKTLETEDIPIAGIINSNHHESTRLIKKEGLIEEPKKPRLENQKSSAKIWFKMPSVTTERFTTPQVEYAVEDVSPATRRRPRKQLLNLNQNNQNNQNINKNNNNNNNGNGRNTANGQNHNLNSNSNRDQNQRPQRQQQQQGQPKLSYRFEWGKRSDEIEPPKSENHKVEEPVTNSGIRSDDDSVGNDDNEDEDEEVTSIRELEEFRAAKWDGRRTFKDNNEEITTTVPARNQKQQHQQPKTERIEKQNRQAVRIRENPENFDKDKSAKELAPKTIYSWTSSIDHGSYKEENNNNNNQKPQKQLKADIKISAKIQNKPAVTEEPAKPANTPSRLQKRIDTREREILEDITQRKHNYEVEDVPEERSADQRQPAPRGGDETGEEGKEWRLEDSIPGVPGQDYATFETVPQTNFKCTDHKLPGYYGDMEAKCQVFHVCQQGGRQDSFVCPIGTVFNQQLFVCDWWNNFKCDQTPNFYELNANLYDYSKGGGTAPVNSNKPRGTRGADSEIEAIDGGGGDDNTDDGPENAPLKGGSIYAEDEETKGGSHRSSSRVYFPENTGVGNVRVWKRKLQTEAVTERRSDSHKALSKSKLSDEDEYWAAASEEKPVAASVPVAAASSSVSFATRLSSLLKVKSNGEQKVKQ